jgi:predicted nuclease of predicted toxin-antitoxin system
MLKFIIDHNIPKSVSDFLISKGHKIVLVKEINSRMTDLQIVQYSKVHKLIILSNDKDFIALSLKYTAVDMILFNYLSQKSDIRIKGLKSIINQIEPPFGVIILQ